MQTPNQTIVLDPGNCFLISMFFVITADGEVDAEEVGYLTSVLGGKRRGKSVEVQHSQRVEVCLQYVRTHSAHDFLSQIQTRQLLNQEQKMYILVHMLDLAYADGDAAAKEGQIISAFKDAFGVNNDQFTAFHSMIKFKYRKSIIGL